MLELFANQLKAPFQPVFESQEFAATLINQIEMDFKLFEWNDTF